MWEFAVWAFAGCGLYEFEGWLGFGDQFTCLGPGLLSHFGCRVYDEFTSLGLNPKP